MKIEWGKKVSCPACGTLFFDMRKTELTCPKCSKKFKASDLRKKAIDDTQYAEEDDLPIVTMDGKSYDFEEEFTEGDNSSEDVREDIKGFDRMRDDEG